MKGKSQKINKKKRLNFNRRISKNKRMFDIRSISLSTFKIESNTLPEKKKYRLIRVQKVFLDSEFEIKILDILFYLKGSLDFQFWQQLYFSFMDVCGA